MSREKIYVTRPSLAPLTEYESYLAGIWESGIMTHNGPLVQRLERALRDYLGVDNVVCVSSGTCALQLAIRALDLTGEIITTPFSFIATANIINWERCVPVFIDIDPETWNLDPTLISRAVTARTTAVLPVHVFSAPCDVDGVEEAAAKHDLKVIYDAAHAMGVRRGNESLLSRGDVSAVSFHATKIFNTGEGGACVTSDGELAERIRRMRFFGFDAGKDVVDVGMNAKMTELNAGLGLVNLRRFDLTLSTRRRKCELYERLLAGVRGVRFQKCRRNEYNHSYMPVLFDGEERLLRVIERLNRDGIFPRRYFHPSLNRLAIFPKTSPLPVSESVADRILCLPLYDDLADADIERICGHVAER